MQMLWKHELVKDTCLWTELKHQHGYIGRYKGLVDGNPSLEAKPRGKHHTPGCGEGERLGGGGRCEQAGARGERCMALCSREAGAKK